MKIAIVHDFLLKRGGAERVVKVLADMFPEAPIFTLLYDEKKMSEVFPAERVRTSFLQEYPHFIRKRYRYLAGKMPRAIEELDLNGFDLVISSSGAYSHGVLTSLDTKHLCYCHSPMRYAWDWTHQYSRDNGLTGLKKTLWMKLVNYLRQWDFVAADRADRYLANSEHVQTRLKKYYKTESDVLYPPVDIDRFKVSKKHDDFFLIVSTLTQYKKIDLAISLFNKIGRKLVIIGEGPSRKYLQEIAGDNIEFLGFQEDEVVDEYLSKCRALIFPGEDDFGIVPIEAMACGKPVLAFGKGGALETIEPGKTGEFFYEETVASMEDGLGRLLHNEKFYKGVDMREQAEKFGRQNFEKKLKRKIKQLMKEDEHAKL